MRVATNVVMTMRAPRLKSEVSTPTLWHEKDLLLASNPNELFLHAKTYIQSIVSPVISLPKTDEHTDLNYIPTTATCSSNSLQCQKNTTLLTTTGPVVVR